MAARFGTRPSVIVGLADDVLALDFDLALDQLMASAEHAAARSDQSALDSLLAKMSGQRGSIGPDERYETIDDLPPDMRDRLRADQRMH